MSVVSLLHQKGGTGKSTLAIAAAISYLGAGEKVVLIDADPQGTSGDWGNRFGSAFGLEVVSHIRPNFPALVESLRQDWERIVIDGPPSLSPVTESILAASDRVIVPVRPSLPDLWSIPWFATVVKKLRGSGHPLRPLVVFNMHRGEALEPLNAEISAWNIPAWHESIPADEAFPRLFEGVPLPQRLAEMIGRLIADEP
ncbi:MAG: ParA family protein [SAR324 cluster bacterium]|nr:ParA family protein [SAR324 cluster bacterium]